MAEEPTRLPEPGDRRRVPRAMVMTAARAGSPDGTTNGVTRVAATPEPVSVAELAGLVELGRPAIAPGGRWVAVLRETPGATCELVAVPVSPGAATEFVASVGRPIGRPVWNRDGTAVIVAAHATAEPDQAVDTPVVTEFHRLAVDSGEVSTLWVPTGSRVRKLLAHPMLTDSVIVLTAGTDRDPAGLSVVDLLDGSMRSPAPTPGAVDAACSPDASLAAIVTTTGDTTELSLLDLRTGQPLRTLCRHASPPTTRDQTLEFSPDGESLLFSHGGSRDGHRAAVVAVSGEEEFRFLLPDSLGTVLSAEFESDRTVLAQVFERNRSVLRRVELADGRTRHRRLAELHTGHPRFSVCRKTGRIAVVSGSASTAPDLSIWSATTPRRLTDTNPRLRDRATGRLREVSWSSSVDGTTITGLLVTPPDDRSHSGRLVVNVHGGPHFHWSSGWLGSWVDWAQLLAGNGFAVLLPNPRGSTGRGWEYAHDVRGNLGDLPLRDVLDGVDVMVADGVADSRAVGIGGWSYGGYLSAWAVAATDRFAAAVVGAGISDYHRFLGTSVMGRAWREFVPDGRYPHRDAFEAVSPLHRMTAGTTPTLIAHGEADRKIPVEQALLLHEALVRRDVATRLLTFPGEGHVLSTVPARRRLLTGVLDWFRTHLP